MLRRERFFGVPDDEKLSTLRMRGLTRGDHGCLGVQVRQAVELLVAAIAARTPHSRREASGTVL